MLERADRKVVITVNGTDKTAEYQFKCNLCKQIDMCENVSNCKHIRYVGDHTNAHVQCELLEKNRHIVAIPVKDSIEFAKVRTVVERTHRKRMYPHAKLNVKIK